MPTTIKELPQRNVLLFLYPLSYYLLRNGVGLGIRLRTTAIYLLNYVSTMSYLIYFVNQIYAYLRL